MAEGETTNVKCKCNCNASAAGGGIYGLAFIGALVYYLQHSATFVDGVWGFLKALVWPAIMAFKFLEFLYR